MSIIIEVGSNKGTDTEKWLRDPKNIVYCFEPTPELCTLLWEKFSKFDNFHLFAGAIDIKNSWRQFNIAGQKDWGCSSLHNFNENIDTLWPGRKDFKFTKTINTFCIRLDSFIDMSNIKNIDYLWIDAQGNDWNVLRSLGDKINIVKEGKCEVAYTVNLYNTDNTVENVKTWLESKGFSVSLIPDPVGKECDLHFKK